jgi:hypothetical protein
MNGYLNSAVIRLRMTAVAYPQEDFYRHGRNYL